MMDIEKIFREHRNKENAPAMAKYMRNQFEFLGIKTPERHQLSKEWLREQASKQEIDWSLVNKLWDLPEREFQYLACDYLQKMKKYLQTPDLEKIAALAQQKSWWDSVDNLDVLVGEIITRNPTLKAEMLAWSKADSFWLRRLAIDYQLQFKEKTDKDLLAAIIRNNFGEEEFFINKAIGWALRQYSKTNPDWVRDFINKNEEELNPLSLREGSKYL